MRRRFEDFLPGDMERWQEEFYTPELAKGFAKMVKQYIPHGKIYIRRGKVCVIKTQCLAEAWFLTFHTVSVQLSWWGLKPPKELTSLATVAGNRAKRGKYNYFETLDGKRMSCDEFIKGTLGVICPYIK